MIFSYIFSEIPFKVEYSHGRFLKTLQCYYSFIKKEDIEPEAVLKMSYEYYIGSEAIFRTSIYVNAIICDTDYSKYPTLHHLLYRLQEID